MLNYDDALIEARQHLYSTTPPHGFVWVLKHGQRVTDGWFFWQAPQPIRYIVTMDHWMGGGHVGFTVMDDRSIRPHGLLNLPPEVNADHDPNTANNERS